MKNILFSVLYILYIFILLIILTPTTIPGGVIFILSTLGLFLWTLKKELRLKKSLLALAPFIFAIAANFFGAIIHYYGKDPHFITFGLVRGRALYNHHPVYRIKRHTSGCVITGGEFIIHPAHNAGVKLAYYLTGPAPNSYKGPFPSQEEAFLLHNKDRTKGDSVAGKYTFKTGAVNGISIDPLVIIPDMEFSKPPASVYYYTLLDDHTILLEPGNGSLYLVDMTNRQLIYNYTFLPD